MVEVLELVLHFFSKREPTVLKIGKKFPYVISCYVRICCKKRGAKNIQREVVSANCIPLRFLITRFRLIKLNVRKPFQIGGSLSALFSSTVCALTSALT